MQSCIYESGSVGRNEPAVACVISIDSLELADDTRRWAAEKDDDDKMGQDEMSKTECFLPWWMHTRLARRWVPKRNAPNSFLRAGKIESGAEKPYT